MDLTRLPEARTERRSQLAYVASRNPMAALSVGLRLRDAIETLTQFPHSGRPGRRPGTHELIIADTSLIVIYQANEKPRRKCASSASSTPNKNTLPNKLHVLPRKHFPSVPMSR